MGAVIEGPGIKMEELGDDEKDDLWVLRAPACGQELTLSLGLCSLLNAALSVSRFSLRSLNRLTNPSVFRKQLSMTIDQQRDIGRHFGPLHKHPTYAIPRRGDLDDVVGE